MFGESLVYKMCQQTSSQLLELLVWWKGYERGKWSTQLRWKYLYGKIDFPHYLLNGVNVWPLRKSQAHLPTSSSSSMTADLRVAATLSYLFPWTFYLLSTWLRTFKFSTILVTPSKRYDNLLLIVKPCCSLWQSYFDTNILNNITK